jgi:hypothetical protein
MTTPFTLGGVKLKFFILEKYFGDQDKKNNYEYENHENRLQSY